MSSSSLEVYLNRFAIKEFRDSEKTVYVYTYKFVTPPKPGKEYLAVNKILGKIGTAGARLKSNIITKEKIAEKCLKQKDWELQLQGDQLLNISKINERIALETLERRWLKKQLESIFIGKRRVEKAAEGGYICWDKNKIIRQGAGWEVNTGVQIDIEIFDHKSGILFIKIDIHHRFYSPWDLENWSQRYPDINISWVRNTYDNTSWKLARITKQKPEDKIIEELGISVAEYHLQKGATEAEISKGYLVYVKNKKGQEIPHISTRLRPSLTMEMLSILAEKGDQAAKKVFPEVRKSTQERFAKGKEVAQYLAKNIYKVEIEEIKPQKTTGLFLRNNNKSPLLGKSNQTIIRPEQSLEIGCFCPGENQFGCLDLVGNGKWSTNIKQKLENAAKKSGVEITIEAAKQKSDLPESFLSRKQFWQNWAKQGTNTVLVISNWLKNEKKYQLRKEALEANIALQFMQPMPNDYRAVNIVLGLLLKAKWQPVGLQPLEDPQAAEIVIGFDAGTNRNLYYGTSAFAILGDGQSLGWEIPEAQPGEKLSGQAVLRTTLNIISRFEKIKGKRPQRILLLRDGLVQSEEFEAVLEALKQEKIAADLLGVRKSGAGRMAVSRDALFRDVQAGTAVLSKDNNTFLLVSSKPNSGGAARPLKIVRDYGDASLKILAQQVDRLCQLNPASGYTSSRLPYVIHFADKMAKEVQRIGEVAILHNIDREKIFFV